MLMLVHVAKCCESVTLYPKVTGTAPLGGTSTALHISIKLLHAC